MLLDFNLSIDWREPADGHPVGSSPPTGETGGTLAYMAPERLEAIADPANAPTAGPLDRHRADLYGLGLVLREALTGQAPWIPERRPRSARQLAAAIARARRDGPGDMPPAPAAIPAGLRPILRRCLAADPADRYARAANWPRTSTASAPTSPPAHPPAVLGRGPPPCPPPEVPVDRPCNLCAVRGASVPRGEVGLPG